MASRSPSYNVQPSLKLPQTLDAQFASLAKTVPGFAGLYFDSDGTLILQLTSVANMEMAEEAIMPFLAAGGRSNAKAVASKLRRHQVSYDYAQLIRWYEILKSKPLPSGVTLTDIDERQNRIFVGVSDAFASERVRSFLASLPIPSNAVTVEVEGVSQPDGTLQQLVDPLKAGAVFVVQGLGSCTVGGIGYKWTIDGFDYSAPYFLTNSHCTTVAGQVDGGIAGQPDLGRPIASEAVDPATFTRDTNPYTVWYEPGGGCPIGLSCRYSDAALYLLYNGIAVSNGTSAYTNGTNLTITDTRTFSYAGATVVGDAVTKVGAFGGTRTGSVTRSCFDTSQGGTPTWFLCQNEATYISIPGDSGGPVFRSCTGANCSADYQPVTLVGLNWGHTSANRGLFSDIGYVNMELARSLGTFTVHFTTQFTSYPYD